MRSPTQPDTGSALLRQRHGPYLALSVLTTVVTVGVMNLPESFVSGLRIQYGLDTSQAGWIYRLLAVATCAQAIFGGYYVLAPSRVAPTNREPESTMRMFVRTSVVLVVLTLTYGLAALWLTGYRGGFWLFITVAVLQGAWYFRSLNDIARLALTGMPRVSGRATRSWTGLDDQYVPPVARGVADADPRSPEGGAGLR